MQFWYQLRIEQKTRGKFQKRPIPLWGYNKSLTRCRFMCTRIHFQFQKRQWHQSSVKIGIIFRESTRPRPFWTKDLRILVPGFLYKCFSSFLRKEKKSLRYTVFCASPKKSMVGQERGERQDSNLNENDSAID